MIIHKWEKRSDGELLELIERMRVHVNKQFPNNTTANATGEWLSLQIPFLPG